MKTSYEDAARYYDNMEPDDDTTSLIDPEDPMEELDGGDYA